MRLSKHPNFICWTLQQTNNPSDILSLQKQFRNWQWASTGEDKTSKWPLHEQPNSRQTNLHRRKKTTCLHDGGSEKTSQMWNIVKSRLNWSLKNQDRYTTYTTPGDRISTFCKSFNMLLNMSSTLSFERALSQGPSDHLLLIYSYSCPSFYFLPFFETSEYHTKSKKNVELIIKNILFGLLFDFCFGILFLISNMKKPILDSA